MPFGLVGSYDFFNVFSQENILDGKQSIFLKAKLSARFLYPAPSVLRFELAGHFSTSLAFVPVCACPL